MDRTLTEMWDDSTTWSDDPLGSRNDRLSDVPVVLPAPDVWAIVPFAPPPESPPDDLAAFAVLRDGNWVLTDDALAFGEVETIERFHEWRSTWERVWTLDSLTNLFRLIVLAREIAPAASGIGGVFDPALTDYLSDDDVVEVPPSIAGLAASALARVGDLVRERGELGYGIVDRSPNSERVGLAKAWPACGGDEIVVGGPSMRIVFTPSQGLFCELPPSSSPSGVADRIGPIERAEQTDGEWTIWGGNREHSFVADQGRPLSWLVPGATAWVVREIPEVLAWAKTLAGLAEAFAYAESISAPVRLTARRPIADGS